MPHLSPTRWPWETSGDLSSKRASARSLSVPTRKFAKISKVLRQYTVLSKSDQITTDKRKYAVLSKSDQTITDKRTSKLRNAWGTSRKKAWGIRIEYGREQRSGSMFNSFWFLCDVAVMSFRSLKMNSKILQWMNIYVYTFVIEWSRASLCIKNLPYVPYVLSCTCHEANCCTLEIINIFENS